MKTKCRSVGPSNEAVLEVRKKINWTAKKDRTVSPSSGLVISPLSMQEPPVLFLVEADVATCRLFFVCVADAFLRDSLRLELVSGRH